MNICIVTVYNNECCGSFWQAYALMNTLEKMGHQIFFYKLDKKGSAHSLSFHITETAKRLVKLKYSEITLEWKRYQKFCKAQKIFKVIDKNSKEFSNIDCFIVGSDTIWNIEKKKYRDKINIFFGWEFFGKKIISYAASVANTSEEKFINNKKAINGAQKMADISVRDISTYNIVKNIFNVNPTIVCDPTILLNKNEYNKLIDKSSPFENSPILIYYYGNFPDKTVDQINTLKKETGKKIISFGQYRQWCDINLPLDPYLFIQCFRDCSFVITNTYHGTVFSLIYQKNFANYGQTKKKVEYLLDSLDATNAFALDDDELEPFYNGKLNYKLINDKLDKLKLDSKDFLKRNLCN